MSSFLIDRDSPIRSTGDSSRTRLHHRSRQSESESNDSPIHSSRQSQPSATEDNQKFKSEKSDNIKSEKSDNIKGPSMFNYFKSELTRSYKLEGNASEFVQRRDRIYTSVNTPKSLEKFCAFGLLQCLDSILNIMTFLPLRIIVALIHALTYPCAVMFLKKRAVLNPAQICDVLKGVILVVSCFITSYIDMSIVYHIVKGHSVIKFYVIYNMLDVMDKLISGFGQDVLDSLYWTAVEPRGRKREHFGTIFHLMFAISYVVIHTVLILVQAITLNVAFNSENKNLLTIMLSNNFIEIKANLFKRLDKNTLCQVSYGDVKERFHYLVLLLFIFIHNLQMENWLTVKAPYYVVDAITVLCVEVIVDWIKHSFITKINEFSACFYSDFAVGLAQDIASSQKKHAFTDFSDQVCRRMGFTPIPLTCLLYMVCRKTFKITGMISWVIVFILYLCLFTTKVLNSIILLGWAQHLITEGDKNAKSTVIVGNSQVMPKKEGPKTETKVKTESISHCPNIAYPLSPDLLKSEPPIVHKDPWQSPATSDSSPSSNPVAISTTKSRSSKPNDEDPLLEGSLQKFPTNSVTISHQNGNNSVMQDERNILQPQTEVYAKEALKIEDQVNPDNKNNSNEDKDDLYNILVHGVDGSTLHHTHDSSLSQPTVTSLESPNIFESRELESSPQQLSNDSNEPFMLKLSSSLPSHFDHVKSDISVSKKEMLPSNSSSLDISFVDRTDLFSKDNEQTDIETSQDISVSDVSTLFTEEKIGNKDISLQKGTDS